ncbi:MAG: serine hydrolase, partial [Saprospiraceae bacterium]|nr:serine hydrolase [Saprospiraceae bacterium]
ASMLGGVSGHAGLFSDANDLAILMQMLLQHGRYGNHQFVDSSTVRIFTRREPMSTRTGIGFDLFKTNPNMKRGMPPQASGRTFGHIGFTGTCTWVDPVNNLVYVFLANRTYPSKDNYKINRMGIRSRILSVVYDAMENGVKPDEPEMQASELIPTKPLPKEISSNQMNSTAGIVN